MNDPLTDFLKNLNPNSEEAKELIYGAEYDLWKDDKYLGRAYWVEDPNVGSSFQTIRLEANGSPIRNVWTPDRWSLYRYPGEERKTATIPTPEVFGALLFAMHKHAAEYLKFEFEGEDCMDAPDTIIYSEDDILKLFAAFGFPAPVWGSSLSLEEYLKSEKA